MTRSELYSLADCLDRRVSGIGNSESRIERMLPVLEECVAAPLAEMEKWLGIMAQDSSAYAAGESAGIARVRSLLGRLWAEHRQAMQESPFLGPERRPHLAEIIYKVDVAFEPTETQPFETMRVRLEKLEAAMKRLLAYGERDDREARDQGILGPTECGFITGVSKEALEG